MARVNGLLLLTENLAQGDRVLATIYPSILIVHPLDCLDVDAYTYEDRMHLLDMGEFGVQLCTRECTLPKLLAWASIP